MATTHHSHRPGAHPDQPDQQTQQDREAAEAELQREAARKIAVKVLSTGVLAPEPLLAHLQAKGIERAPIEKAIRAGMLGLNTHTSRTQPAGAKGYGGPAATYVVRDQHAAEVVAVDMHYLDPALNGDQATLTKGDAQGPWCSNWKLVATAKTVYVVQTCLDALAVESCLVPADQAKPHIAVIATRGTWGLDQVDWTMLRGKQVLGCFHNDKPGEHGYCAGLSAFWRLHELLTGLDISCLMVEQGEWRDRNDAKVQYTSVADVLLAWGVADTTRALRKLQEWLIPGLIGDRERLGKPRLWLPGHDFSAYWKYRVKEDFTQVVGKVTKPEEGDVDGKDKLDFQEVCGFRVAAVSRVRIASDHSTMTGNPDNAPTTMFALSVQVARHGATLQRIVVEDEKLHNIEVWQKLGPVFAPTPFKRLINVWERAAGIGARDAGNFVGLCWREGKLALNEGTDCYFTDPHEQCPYHNLTFPSASLEDGVRVIQEFQRTFSHGEAAMPLVWALGAHLKAFLGFWPHFVMQSDKGAGKSTVVKAIGTAVAMHQFSRQTLQSEYRIIGSVSYTSQPVAWGEFSTNKQELRTKAIGTLQESYQYESTSRGVGLKRKFLMCAPVLLNGEDVPVDGLEGKIVRSTLTKDRRGAVISADCPTFPMREWIRWLATLKKEDVLALHAHWVMRLGVSSVARADDAGAERMVTNYAAVQVAWQLLQDFLDAKEGDELEYFESFLTTQMNEHITETGATRHPWVWIIEKALSEIARKEFRYPFVYEGEDADEVLCIRTSHIMEHISTSTGLRAFYDELPIKSDRALKKQLLQAGVLVVDPKRPTEPLAVEKTVHSMRIGHMVQLKLAALKQYGLHAVVPKHKIEE